MVIMIPHTQLSTKQKRAIIAANYSLYKKARKKEKTLILDELETATGYARKFIIYLLKFHKKRLYKKSKKVVLEGDIKKSATSLRGRKKKYPPHLAKILFEIWKLTGGISSKHIKAFIEENYDDLWEYPELRDVSEEDKVLISQMSPATIDRLLKPLRDKYKASIFPFPLKKSKKKAAHLVKGQIDIEIWKERRSKIPGTREVDLVEHNGGNPAGEFLYTLTAVDVATYWVFLRVLRNKARIWTKEALDNIVISSPFKINHIHSDNGSEFINAHLLEYTKQKKIKFTRSRVHICNDNPNVENRNMMVVRRYVGYRRYSTQKEQEILENFYRYVELRHNFFIPTMKLTYKEKAGKKYKRHYEIKTPYKRLLDREDIPEEIKQQLRQLKSSLNLRTINKEIVSLYNKLEIAYNNKKRGRLYETKNNLGKIFSFLSPPGEREIIIFPSIISLTQKYYNSPL